MYREKYNLRIDESTLLDFVNKIQKDMNNLPPSDKYLQLEILMDLFIIDVDLRGKIKERWFTFEKYDLFQFAPYTMFCQKVMFTFFLGTSLGIFDPRNSNLIDMEYLMYLPFCFIFCTGDNFQYKICKMINTGGSQHIISHLDLKRDLKLISDHLETNQENSSSELPKESLTKKILEDYISFEKNI